MEKKIIWILGHLDPSLASFDAKIRALLQLFYGVPKNDEEEGIFGILEEIRRG